MRLARVAAATPGVVVDTTDLAVSLGLGESLSHNGALARSIGRLIAFDAAYRGWGDAFVVRRALPDVSEGQLRRLSWSAQVAHDRFRSSR